VIAYYALDSRSIYLNFIYSMLILRIIYKLSLSLYTNSMIFSAWPSDNKYSIVVRLNATSYIQPIVQTYIFAKIDFSHRCTLLELQKFFSRLLHIWFSILGLDGHQAQLQNSKSLGTLFDIKEKTVLVTMAVTLLSRLWFLSSFPYSFTKN